MSGSLAFWALAILALAYTAMRNLLVRESCGGRGLGEGLALSYVRGRWKIHPLRGCCIPLELG